MSRRRTLGVVVALEVVGCALVAAVCMRSSYSPPPVAFSGDSATAKDTVVVPTLDTPAPAGKNVIWCATFQLCWDELKPVVGAFNVPGAEETIRRLDGGRINAADMPAGGYYTAAGWVKDGIVGKIQSDMAAKFPQVKPNLPPVDADTVALAYAYLSDAVKFATPYFDREQGDDFTDSTGRKTRITSFGMYDKNLLADVNVKLSRQIGVLYADKEDFQPKEFVLDLDKNSQPAQLILACVAPKESLAATWQEVQEKIGSWEPAEHEREFGEDESLAVPNINYKIQHNFKELETSKLLKTCQVIEFRLDRSGAVVVSESDMAYAAQPRTFSFTRPFLIAMRKRGSAEPYFVMWVDNAELLCKPATK